MKKVSQMNYQSKYWIRRDDVSQRYKPIWDEFYCIVRNSYQKIYLFGMSNTYNGIWMNLKKYNSVAKKYSRAGHFQQT